MTIVEEMPAKNLAAPQYSEKTHTPERLSTAQREIWREHALFPDGAVHTIGARTDIRGPFSPEVLERSLAWAWDRHDALRLTAQMGGVGDEPLQIEACKPIRFLTHHDVEDATDPIAAADELADTLGRQVIPLNGGPTFRFHLIRVAKERHVWVMCYHHINMDAWANGILVRDVAEAYRAFIKDVQPDMPPAPSYRDQISADEKFATSVRAERNLDYWLNLHATSPDRVTEAVTGVLEGEAPPATFLHRLSVDHEMLARLRKTAAEHGAPPARLFIAACLITFHLHSRARDIVFGMPVLNRPTARDKATFGLCSLATAPRLAIDAGDDLGTVLSRLDLAMRGAMRHYRSPMSEVGRRLGLINRRVSQLFDINISYERVDYGEIDFGPAVGSVPRVLLNGVARTPVEMFVREYGDTERVEVDLDLSMGAFDQDESAKVSVRYLRVLDWLSRGGVGGVSSVPLLDVSERDWLVRGVNATFRDYGEVVPVHRRIEAVAASSPDAPAVRFEGLEVSYGDLNARANALARRLLRAGVVPESRVGVALERSVELVVGLLAVLKAGGCYVPLDLELPSDRLSFMTADADVEVVVTRAGLLDLLPAHDGRVVTVDGVGRGSRGGSGNPDVVMGPENLAYVIYTSGSTGRPKGVMNAHSGLWNRLRWMQEAFPIGPGDRVLQKTPFTFDVSVWEFFWPLMEGACLVVSRPGGHRDPDYLAGVLRDESITVAHFVPSMLQAFLGHGASASLLGSCGSLRQVICSGEALSTSLAARFREHAPSGAVLHNLYGPTEAAIDVSHWACDGDPVDPLPIGHAIANTALYVLDGALEPVPVGVVGELWIGGVQVSRGYLGRAGLTSESFVADPHGGVSGARMYRTGDLARRMDNGALTYLGRIDDQVKLRGFRIELGEVETALLGHAAIGSAAVILREDRADDARIVGYVVPEGGVAPADLDDHLRGLLPDHMVPSDIVVLDALPVTANGKLDRAALPTPSGAGAGAGGQARGPEEEVACAVFAGVLGREEVGAEDNFFALGGHSLLAVQAVGRLRTALDVELPANAVLAAPTPREIAARIRGARRIERLAVPERGFDVPRLATAAETRLWFLQRRDPEDTSYNMTGVTDLDDGVDLEALGRALAAVRRRHQTLHSLFELRGDAVWVTPDPGLARPSLVEGPLSEKAATAIARDMAATPFDLATEPASRARLLRLDDGRARLVLGFHHIGADARSVSVFGRDLDAAYAMAVADITLDVEALKARLPEPAADPLRAEALGAAGIDVEAALERWRIKLDGAPAGLDLPREGGTPVRGVIETRLHVDSALRHRLSRLAVSGRATVFMVLHAALAGVLSRVSGQSDITIGTPVDLRGEPDLADTVGMLLNSVPLRLRIDPSSCGDALVEMSRETVLAALADASVPLERIVAVADPDRQNTRAPLFQVLLTNHAPHLSDLSLGGMALGTQVVPQTEAKMDLVVLCADNGVEIDVTIESAAGLFDEAGAQRFAAMLGRGLAAIVDHPDMPIGMIPLLDDEAILAETRSQDAADTRRAPDGAVPDRFRAVALKHPLEIAIEDVDGRVIEYRTLDDLTDRIAGALVARGVRHGDRVGLRMARGLDQIAGMLGVLKAGAAYVPLDPEQPGTRLDEMTEDAGIQVVVTDGEGPSTKTGAVSFSTLARSAAAAPKVMVSGADSAYVMFTSGSTGRPKGIVIPHRAVLRLAIDPGFAEFHPGKRVAQVATTAFDAATYEIWCALLNGATTVIIDRAATYEPEALAAAFSAAAVRSTFLTASVFNRTARAETDAFSHLDEVIFGGEAADAVAVRAAVARWPEVRFINGYGPTETTTFAACHPVDAMALEDVTVPIGRPIRATALYVLDDSLTPVPRGSSGELFIGGDGLADGYVGDPMRTASCFVADPFSEIPGARMYRTGDLVRRDSRGAIVYLGRIDRQIKLRGFRIEPGEIEAKLSALLGDKSEVVVDARATEDDRALFGWVIGRELDAGEERKLRAGLAGHLPSWMLPRRIIGVDAPPLTPNGKLDRGALRIPDMSGEPAVTDSSSDNTRGTRTETQLAEIWSSLLDGASVGHTDSFFSAGGHSLLGVGLISRVREAFGIDLPLRAVFETPVLSDMASIIDDLMKEGAPSFGAGLVARVRADDTRPVSANQARLALMDRIDGSGAAYTIPVAILVDGPIEPIAFETALRALLLRHEPLRSIVRIDENRLEAKALGPEAIQLAVKEQGQVDLAAARSAVETWARDEAARPFDLGNEPPLRACLLRFGSERSGVVLTVHHIAADGHSMPILMDELSMLYRKASAGSVIADEVPAFSYADWTDWVLQAREDRSQAVQSAVEALDGAPELLELPFDRPRPSRRDHRGDVAQFDITSDLEKRIEGLSGRLGTTPFAVLTSAFALLLARLSGVEDVVLGIPVAGRDRAEVKDLIGFFADTAVLRVRLDNEADGAALVERVHADLARVLSYPVPFDALVEAIDPRRETSHGPVFQAMIALNEEDSALSQFGDAKAEALLVHPGTAKFDLQLQIIRHDGTLRCALEYASDVFDHETVVAFSVRYLRVLDWLSRGGVGGVSSVPLLDVSERDWLVRGVNATFRDYGEVVPVHRRIEAVAASSPDAPAVRFEGLEVSYGDLNARANALARRLLRAGVVPESRVGVALERSVELVVGLLAVLKAGGCYVPLDLELPSDRLSFMTADADVEVVVTRAGLLDLLPAHDGRVVTVDGVGRGSRGGSGNPDVVMGPENLAYVIYTSGSTGRPKGVMNAHSGLWNRLRWMQEAFPIGPGDRVLQKTPFTFDVSVWEFFWPLMEGACLVVSRPGGHRDPDYLAGVLRDESITVAHFVPSMLQAFLGHGASASLLGSCGSLRQVICSGEALSTSLAARFREHAPSGAVLHNLYGPTEAAIDVSHWACDGDPVDPLPIGHAIANTALYVLDGALEPVPVGVVGELWIGGVQVSRGYLGRAGLTSESFVADPHGGVSGARMYRTGDLARRMDNGALTYLGRIDDQVKLRGFRIELGEVETALLGHAAIGSAAVILREDRADDARIVGYVVPEGGVAPADLDDHLRGLLPDHMVPSDIVVLDALPVTANGKLDRAALPTPSGAGAGAGGQARGPEEEVACAVFAGVLGREEVGAEDNFFALGGHSLLAVQAVGRLRTALDVELPANAVFENPTPRQIAEIVRSGRGQVRSSINRRAEDATVLPSLGQRQLWFLCGLEGSEAYNVPDGFIVDGPLDLEALTAAVSDVMALHEALRAVLHERDGEPVVEVLEPVRVEISLDHLKSSDSDELATWFKSQALRPFNIESEVPIRVSAASIPNGRHAIALVMHHSATDGASAPILYKDLSQAYRERRQGRALRRDEPAVRYYDWAMWQREWAASGLMDAAVERAKIRLANPPEGLALPEDFPRVDPNAFEGAMLRISIPIELSASLRQRAREAGATLFMVLTAGLGAFLGRLGNQDDIIVGAPVSGRARAETDGLVGFLVNTVALRLRPANIMTLADMLDATRQQVLDAFSDSDLPLDRIVQALAPKRTQSRTPLFRVMIALQPADRMSLELDGASVLPVNIDAVSARYDLTFAFDDDGHGLDLVLHYAADLFSEETGHMLADGLINVLRSVSDNPNRRIEDIDLPLQDPVRGEVSGSGSFDERTRQDEDLLTLFQRGLATGPDRPALEDSDGTVTTYRSLDQQSDRVAAGLKRAGIGCGDLVALAMERNPGLVTAMLSVLKRGGAYVVIEADQAPGRASMMIEDAEARAIIHDNPLPKCLSGPVTNAKMLSLDNLLEVEDVDAISVKRGGDDICSVNFVSSARGRPKGVMVSDRTIQRMPGGGDFADIEFKGRVARVDIGELDIGDREIWGTLLNGGCLVFLKPHAGLAPDVLAETMLTKRIDTLFLTTVAFTAAVEAHADVFSGVRQVLFAGDVTDVETARHAAARWPVVRFTQLFGQSETGGLASYRKVDNSILAAKTLPIGHPVRGSSLYILDEALNPVPRGMPGRLYIGGDLAIGYIRDPALTAEAFLADPFSSVPGARMFRTGDQVRGRHDGGLEYIRRLDRRITLNGYRFEPGEIEAAIRSNLPGVGDVFVAAWHVDAEGQGDVVLRAWGVNLPTGEDHEPSQRSALSDILPPWMVPDHFISLDVMPVLDDGTVDQQSLPLPILDDEVEPLGKVMETDTERSLAEIWSGLLNGAPVDAGDTFFEVGGHSLLGVKLAAKVRQTFGVALELRSIFEHPELKAMGRIIDEARENAATGGVVVGEEPIIKRRARRGATGGGRRPQ